MKKKSIQIRVISKANKSVNSTGSPLQKQATGITDLRKGTRRYPSEQDEKMHTLFSAETIRMPSSGGKEEQETAEAVSRTRMRRAGVVRVWRGGGIASGGPSALTARRRLTLLVLVEI